MRTTFVFLVLAASYLNAQSYSTFADTERRLQALARQHGDAARLLNAGTSAGGKGIHVLEIAGKGATPPASRPGVFVGANIVGFHNAGTEAALKLAEKLLANKSAPLLQNRVFYIAPALNPDAHDGMFGKVKQRLSLNAMKLDRDLDGLLGEDGPDDLNGDGMITQMRIPDPNGAYLVDADGRTMKLADAVKGEKGTHRVVTEGADNDRDGQYNEDPAGGLRPDKNFAHGWADNDPEAGSYPSVTPEAKAVMDFLLARRNVAVAFVFGPANNLLEMPRGVGNAADIGQTRVTPSAFQAQALGLEARPYTVDEVFGILQGTPSLAQLGGTKEALAAFLGGGPATAPDPEDVKYYQSFADEYKKILEKAQLDAKRAGRQSPTGGLQNWIYYHFGGFVVELDVWGAPKDSKEGFVAWTPVTLPDGTKAEVGGLDPFVEIAPPAAELAKATDAHADAVMMAAERLAKVEILETRAKQIGTGVWQITAIAGNTGRWPTHTKHAVRARTWLPVRLKMTMPSGVALVSGTDQAANERLTPGTGNFKAEWIVRGAAGARVTIDALSQNAGNDRKEIVLP